MNAFRDENASRIAELEEQVEERDELVDHLNSKIEGMRRAHAERCDRDVEKRRAIVSFAAHVAVFASNLAATVHFFERGWTAAAAGCVVVCFGWLLLTLRAWGRVLDS